MATTATTAGTEPAPNTISVRLSAASYAALQAQAEQADVPVGLVARALIESSLHAQAQGRG
jgi:hypothetical protein